MTIWDAFMFWLARLILSLALAFLVFIGVVVYQLVIRRKIEKFSHRKKQIKPKDGKQAF